MADIEDTKGVLILFADASREGFWGEMEFSFQGRRLKMIRKEATFKVKNLISQKSLDRLIYLVVHRN